MKEKCFADRKDGTCHALKCKECEGCRFYFPRELVKDNMFYEYSYQSIGKINYFKRKYNVREEQIMKETD